MPTLAQIVEFLDETLGTNYVKDTSKNGLQVSKEDDQVYRIGFAVDASLEAFERALNANCDLLVVHHGLFWEDPETITGNMFKRIQFLIKNNIALYASHLPLDKHEIYGNAAQLAKLINLQNLKPFGKYHDETVGFAGELDSEQNIIEFVQHLKEELNTNKIKALPFGKKEVKTVAIVTGGGSFALTEAAENGFDVLLTGETSHQSFHPAKEEKINVVFAGHYATETLGLKALAALIKEKFDIEVGFIDIPTDM